MKTSVRNSYPTVSTVAVALGLTTFATASSSLLAGQESASARETIAVSPTMVRLDRADLGTHRNAGIAHQKKSDVARTLDEYSKVIKEDPMDDDAYFRRGVTYFYAGFPLRALADLQMANKLDSDYPYYPLWIDIIDRRSHREGALSEAASRMDMTKWPSPVIRLFLGEVDSGAVLSAANDTDTTKKQEQMCEANFYIGVLALQEGVKEEAVSRFQSAATDCPSDFVEAPAALAELDALGMTAR